MKNNTFKLLSGIFIASLIITGCSNDDSSASPNDPDKPTDNIISIKDSYQIDRSKLLTIIPDLKSFHSPEILWTITGINGNNKDSLISKDEKLHFITLNEGNYSLIINVKDGNNTVEKEFSIRVDKEKKPYKYHIAKVFDFLPAYGQFTNEMPKYEEGDTSEIMRKKAEQAIASENPSMISLGGFGGYVTFGFDHTIVNVPGKRDFRILGNAFANSSEPGIIMVAFDKNANGVPDEDEWYEIVGSEHSNSQVIKNYEITFFKPTAELDATTGNIEEYIQWKDNQGNEGWKPKNQFHSQSYYPLWITQESMTYRGTLLPNNAIESNGIWQLKEFEWGYADNYPNTHDESAIDIAWAVDQNGNKVFLPGIDFIKVYTGLNQEAGWLGETSTEVSGAIDLHIKQETIPTRK